MRLLLLMPSFLVCLRYELQFVPGSNANLLVKRFHLTDHLDFVRQPSMYAPQRTTYILVAQG